MNPDYLDLYAQDTAGDVGFSASPRSEAAIDVANDEAKPLAYRTKIRKGGSKSKKVKLPKLGGTDGGDGRVPEAG